MRQDRNPLQSTPAGELYAPTPECSAPPVLVPPAGAFLPKPFAFGRPLAHITADIVQAKPVHLKLIADLQRKFTNQLGFIPHAATQWYVDNGHVAIARENGEPCGMLLGRPAFRYQPQLRPITQAAIYMDAQRRHHGLALLAALERRALAANQLAMQCCCAEDLTANEFWHAAGFHPMDLILPENRRGRSIVVWRKALTHTLPPWFFTPPPRAGHKAKRNRPIP